MMGRKSGQIGMLMVDMGSMIPSGHLLKKIDATVNFDYIYELLAPYYPSVGRPSVDPMCMFKMLLVGYLYGIKSERRLVEEIQLNIAYRWFCGIWSVRYNNTQLRFGFCQQVPYFILSTRFAGFRFGLGRKPDRKIDFDRLLHVGASYISLAPTFSKVRARSLRCSSFPNRTRFAGPRFGFGRNLERKSILPTYPMIS